MALNARGVTFYMLGVGAHFEYWGVPADKIVEMDWWEERDVSVSWSPARPQGIFGRSLMDRDRTLWSGWALIGESRRVFFSGDTSMTPDFLKVGERYGPFDIAMLESGTYNAAWADAHLRAGG